MWPVPQWRWTCPEQGACSFIPSEIKSLSILCPRLVNMSRTRCMLFYSLKIIGFVSWGKVTPPFCAPLGLASQLDLPHYLLLCLHYLRSFFLIFSPTTWPPLKYLPIFPPGGVLSVFAVQLMRFSAVDMNQMCCCCGTYVLGKVLGQRPAGISRWMGVCNFSGEPKIDMIKHILFVIITQSALIEGGSQAGARIRQPSNCTNNKKGIQTLKTLTL